jgi:hypothetical protein
MAEAEEECRLLEQRISEELERLRYPDPWRPGDHCPQMHRNLNHRIGELCEKCLIYGFAYIPNVRKRYGHDPTWHPEWRIPKAPKRWTTDWHALVAALEWLRREHAVAWEVITEWDESARAWWRMASVYRRGDRRGGVWSGPPEAAAPEMALALALDRWLQAGPSEGDLPPDG